MLERSGHKERIIKINQFDLLPQPKYPQTEPYQRKEEHVTAVVGIKCRDGLVLCADQQISAPDYYKYYENKIFLTVEEDCLLALAYAGSPPLAKEARDKIFRKFEETSVFNDSKIEPEQIEQIADEVFTGMGRLHAELNLQMLIATSIIKRAFSPYSLKMLVFDGHAMHEADKFTCIGVGDSSLIRYLCDTLYVDTMKTLQAVQLGIYMIENAKKYIDHCGGKTDVIIIKEDRRWAYLDEAVVQAVADSACKYDKQNLGRILDKLAVPASYIDPLQ